MDRMCQLNVCIDFNVSIDSNVYIGSYVSTGPSVSYGPLHWTIIKVVTKLLVLQLGLMDVQWTVEPMDMYTGHIKDRPNVSTGLNGHGWTQYSMDNVSSGHPMDCQLYVRWILFYSNGSKVQKPYLSRWFNLISS